MVYAGVMELADVVDSKSTASDGVPVRVRPPAPPRRRGLRFVRGGLFYQKRPPLSRSVAAPLPLKVTLHSPTRLQARSFTAPCR